MIELKNFKKGDKVVMFDCIEAKAIDNYGKVWECESDSFLRDSFQRDSDRPTEMLEVVFLKGYSGSFLCNYLQLIKAEPTLAKEIVSIEKGYGDDSIFFKVGSGGVTKIEKRKKPIEFDSVGITKSMLIYSIYVGDSIVCDLEANSGLCITYNR